MMGQTPPRYRSAVSSWPNHQRSNPCQRAEEQQFSVKIDFLWNVDFRGAGMSWALLIARASLTPAQNGQRRGGDPVGSWNNRPFQNRIVGSGRLECPDPAPP